MKNPLASSFKLLLSFLLLWIGPGALAQLTGVKTIPGDYATVNAAVNALNIAGAGTGGVIFNVAAGHTETTVATISITATGTSSNPIVFQKDPLTSGANPKITAYTGIFTPLSATQDGIWRMLGSDYITIDGFELIDPNTNNPATMEYGFALYKTSATNGCQNDTIRNCVITLNRNNNDVGTAPMADGSTGIIVMNATSSAATSAITVTSATGTNSNNKFYSNTIQNCNTGMALIGFAAASPFTLADNGNDVGGSSLSAGNTILNYGGGGTLSTAIAIRTLAQYGINISYNTINNNDGGGVNHATTLKGIFLNAAASANASVTYNTITIKGGGTTQLITAIENASGSTVAGNTVDISNNTIINSTYTTATTGGFYGIFNTASPSVIAINNNTISGNSSAATTAGYFYGINNSGAASSVTINNNSFTGNSTAALTTGVFCGIYNSSATPSLTINNNTLSGNSTSAVSGLYFPVFNSGAVTTTININSNIIGTALSPAITFNAANSGAQVFINNTGGAGTAALSISSNVFQNISYATAGTGSNTYILNSAATLSQAINSNSFTNLNVNTAGSITFISDNVVVPATGSQNVNSNLISGTFTKAAGGTVTLFSSSTAASAAGSVINHNSNNFSNIIVVGATTIAGWSITDAGNSTRTVQNNTFSNWAGGANGITALSVNLTGANNSTTGNQINNITNGSAITGIATGAGNDNIFSNTINTLSTTGAATVMGISVASGTLKNVYKNKIYDLQANNILGVVYGISLSGTTLISARVYNNFIGDLRTPIASATDPVRGISVTSSATSSSVKIYYNTVYLNAGSTGTNFGSTGIYHTGSATSTTCALTLNNNSVTNISVPNGTGITVGYRRSSINLSNYVSTSNNNLFYGGAASTTRLIFYDGTNKDQTIAAFKTRVTPRDAQSVTEDISSKFLSTSGSSSSYLRMDASRRTQLESGGINITGFTDDADAETRQGNTGYSGTGTAPDIGADEFEGITFQALSGSYNVGAGQTYTSLTKADGLFSAINSVGLAGDVIVNITSDLSEDGANALFQWTEQGGGGYLLTIQPDGSTLRTISGDALAGLVRFNGADRVNIDGSNGGSGKFLKFTNTNTSGTTGSALTYINGATNNTVRYCTLEAFANATNGVVFFNNSTGVGNSNNLIEYCNINGTVSSLNNSNVCIYSAGTTGNENINNTISNNWIYNYRDRGLDIKSTGSYSWTINNNSFYNGDVSAGINYSAATTLHTIRILGGKGYSILNNYIGGNAALATGTSAVYSSTLGILSYQGILLTTTAASPASNIKGNTIAKIAFSTVPTATSSTALYAIETNGSGINVGGSNAGEGNIIGSNTANSSITVTTTTALATYKTNIRGINYNSSGGSVLHNQVGGIDIKNVGTAPGPSTFIGIYVNNAAAPSQVNNNIIGSTGTGAASNSIRVLSTSTAAATGVTGISLGASILSAVQVNGNIVKNISHQSTTSAGNITGISNTALSTAVITISNDTITGNSSSATAGTLYGIYNSAAPASITISNNTISANATAGTSTGQYCIYNTGATPLLTISSNLFLSNTITSASGLFYAIYNTGAVTNAISINSNNIGNGTAGPVTYNAANSGSQIFISNTGGTGAAALSISNNNFQGINYATAGTGTNTYILNSAPTLTQAINGNSFTNLNVQTSGSITFISNSGITPAAGTQNINSNFISGTFTKKAGGTLTFITGSATSIAGSVININSNNFSNVTVTGATVISGLVNTDLGNSTKTIQNNTFSNWTGGTSAITAMTVNITASNNLTTGNLINNITSGGSITAITTGAGNDKILSNIINALSSTAAASVVTGITVTAGTTKNIYRNKIYDLQAATTTGTVNGILVTGGTTVNIYNNIIGDLRTPAANAADVIRAISINSIIVSSTINVYYNTIYLNASSTAATFGTSGIYHLASATATTATLNLINNSITNMSTPGTAGLVVAYRRSSNALANYGAASNNNLFYAGTPGPSRLIFYDVTNSNQGLAAYQAVVGTRDAQSITEDLSAKYLSTTGSSPVFLHMNTTTPSFIESGAINIAGYTDDFDGQFRQGNPGYSGAGYAPDIGADEVFGIEVIAPTITYTILSNTTSTSNRSVTGITITDGSGINTTPGLKPRIYYKRATDANAYADNTSSTNGWKYTEANNTTSPFTFTIDYSLMYGGSTATAGSIQYFVIAQDLATVANIGINSGTFNAMPSSVSLTAAAFPITGIINSYNIPFSGNYNVGTGQVFTSLTKADGIFSAINTVGLTGNVILTITSDISEDGTTALNEWTGSNGLSIQPDGTTLRTVSGNAVSGLIRLNGADRVRIDGSNAGSGSYLNFSNTNIAGTTGTAFTFLNGATNDTIRYCNLEAFASATNGVVFFSTSTGVGNSNNLIEYNTINGTVGTNNSGVGIYSAGTAGNENNSNVISDNTIYNYRDRGIDITSAGSSLWNISNNSFYNGDIAGTINFAASSSLHGVRILGGSGYTIHDNYIGGNTALASGANAVYGSTLGNLSFQGIQLNTGSGTPVSNIRGNTISNITLNSVPSAINSLAFIGIETNGAGINIGGTSAGEGNIIGSNSDNSSISITTTTTSLAFNSVIRGINCMSSGGQVLNNQVAGIGFINIGTTPAPSAFTGIYVNASSAPAQINNNTIGSTSTINSIRVRSTSTATTSSITGILIDNTVASAVQVDNNTISNLSQRSAVSSGSFNGIKNLASVSGASLTITNNTISYISALANTNAASTIFSGISSTSPSTINTNSIDNFLIDASGTNVQIKGIDVSGAFANIISGNTITNLTTASQKTNVVETGSPVAAAIIGILNGANASGQEISSNIIGNLGATTTAAANVVVNGIGITSANSGNIFKNRLYGFTNKATGSAPGISGIMADNGSFNVYNNSIKIDNLPNTNGISLYGIIHDAGGTNWNYFNNSVSISGNSAGTSLRSSAFIRPGEGVLYVRDNIFINTRTGTGTNLAISNAVTSPSLTWAASTSDYNNTYSSNAATVAEWGNNNYLTFAQWQTSSSGDANSLSRSVSFISSVTDLEPEDLTNCSINNSGIAITTPVAVSEDINGITRSTSTPDIGAYEFDYIPFVISAGSNSPVCSGSTVDLTSDPGNAFTPSYSWTNPLSNIISTIQNPTVPALSGVFTVTITDVNGCIATTSTTVSLTTRPTGNLTGPSTICEGSSATIAIAVTGSGTFSGTLSSGDTFSGTAPMINVSVSPVTTTSYNIISLADANCTSVTTDVPDTITIKVTHPGEWTGAVSTNWSNAANWCGGVPASGADISIASNLLRYPIIGAGVSATVGNVVIMQGASLTISNTAALTIRGNWVDTGSLVNNGRIIMNGSGAQTFPGSNASVAAMKELEINNASGVTLDRSLTINGKLIPTAGVLDLADKNITLHSDTLNTAIVTQVAGGFAYSGGGKFIVERFISALNDRAYRLLSAPVITSTSIKDNWQEGVSNTSTINLNPSPGYGTQITGSGGAANGFDATQTNATSLYKFNQATHAWQSVTNTSNVNSLSYLTGYLLYVRGDRSIDMSSQANPLPSNNTTLRASGQLVTGTVPYNNLSNAGEFSLVTNPYAAPIDWSLIYSGSATTNFENFYTYWDPNIGSRGGYVTVTNGNVTSPSNFGAAPYGTKDIQSGQAFFVKTKTGITAPSLTINETHKSSANNIEVFSVTRMQERFPVSLFFHQNGSRRIADGVVGIYQDDYSKNIAEEDAEEIANWDENIAISRAGKNLSIEGRPIITGNDTLPLLMSRMKQQAYEFEFNPQNFDHPNMVIELVDKFTGTRKNISPSGSTLINFNITANASSSTADRFYIVFSTAKPLPVTLTNVVAYNKNEGVQVEWNTEMETNMDKYEVERSATGQQFSRIGSVQSHGNSNVAARYILFDASPAEGNNFYRIRSLDRNGDVKYSAVVKVLITQKPATINIIPNPVQGSVVNINFVNMPKGNYDIRIINVAGQQVYSGVIKYTGDNSTQQVNINTNFPAGVYEIELGNKEVRISKKLFRN